MTERRRLPNRRPSISFDIAVGGLKYKATASYFPDGRVGELFLSNTKPSSQSDVNARDAGVAASLALQFGCPLDVLRASAWSRLTPTKTGPPRSKSQPELQTNFENFVTRSSQNAPIVVRKDRVHEQRHHHHGFSLRRQAARRLRPASSRRACLRSPRSRESQPRLFRNISRGGGSAPKH
jgi:hypothetical protein